MRTTLLSGLALGAVVFAALAQPVVLWAAEPVRLTGTQMDAVTAGAIAVGVGAWATQPALALIHTLIPAPLQPFYARLQRLLI